MEACGRKCSTNNLCSSIPRGGGGGGHTANIGVRGVKQNFEKNRKETVGNVVVDSAFGHKVSLAEDLSGNKDDKSVSCHFICQESLW